MRLLLLSLLGVPLLCVSGTAQNVLRNGGFEEGIEGWSINPAFAPASAEVVVGQEGRAVHGGGKALRLRSQGGWSNLYQNVGRAGRVYELSFWARGVQGADGPEGTGVQPQVNVNLYVYGNTDKLGPDVFLVTLQQMRPRPVGTEWEQLRLPLRLSDADVGGARTFAVALGFEGEVVLDDVLLREVETWRQGLLFHLPFDVGVEATTAEGNPKPVSHGEVRLVEGRKGLAALLTNNANLVFEAEGNFDQSEGTLAFWVKPLWTENDGQPHCFFEVPVAPTLLLDGGFVVTKGFSSGVQPDLTYFYNSPGHRHISTGFGFEPNEWVHVAFCWSVAEKQLRLYRNGEVLRVVQLAQLEPRPSAKGRPMVVGARLGGSSPEGARGDAYFGAIERGLPQNGGFGAEAVVDELMIFNRPLKDEEVARIAEAAAGPSRSREPYDASHLNRLERRLTTPHLKFGKPSALGAVKALFIVPGDFNPAVRDVVELTERCDLNAVAVLAKSPTELGYADEHHRSWAGLSPEEKTKELMERLDAEPEVIVLANMDFARLPSAAQTRIAERVEQGAGLVLVLPRRAPAAFFQQEAPDGREAVLSGVPLSGMAECFPTLRLAPRELGSKIVAAYRCGQGRVVKIVWYEKESLYEVLAPVTVRGRWTRQYEHRYNYYLSLVGKAVQWAGRREPTAGWAKLPAEGQRFDASQWPKDGLPVAVTWTANEPRLCNLKATLRDPLGKCEQRVVLRLQLRTGVNTTSIRLPQPASGTHYLDLVLSARGKVENWASVCFRVQGPEEIVAMTTEREHYELGENVKGVVRFRSPLPAAARLEVSAVDTRGRVYNRAAFPVAARARKCSFLLRADRPTTLASYLHATLTRGGVALSRADTVVFVPKRGDREFKSLLWTGFYGSDTVPGQLALRRLRDAGFNASYHWDYAGDFHNDALADMTPVQYCTRMTFRPDARGWLEGDGFPYTVPRVEDKSLANPKMRKALVRLAAEVTAESGPLGPQWYSLGDENWFHFGFGYSPYGIEYFHEFLRRRYGSIQKLNLEYGSDYADFSQVPRYREDEALRLGLLPALIDHRSATDEEWAAFHRFLAKEIRRLDPRARVGAEGSEPGDLEVMLRGVDVWAPYAGLRDNVLLRSLASPRVLRSHWWGAYASDVYSTEGGPVQLWEWLLRGFANFQEFFAATGVEGILNPDLSFRDYFARILPDLREIYAGIGLLLSGSGVVSDHAVALHYSRASQHASQALKELGTTSGSESTLLLALQELGQDFRYVSPSQIASGKLQSPPARIFFMPASYALSESEAKGIAAFVKKGGTVVADLLPGVLSEYGRRLLVGRLDAVFGATCGGKTSPQALSDLTLQAELDSTTLSLHTTRTVGESALAPQGAKPLAHAGDVPLLAVNRYGKGRAVLLNFDLSRVSRPLRTDFIAGLLRIADVRPVYRLSGSKGAKLSVLRRGDLTLLGVILPVASKGSGKLSWAEAAHAYDVRAGRYLGKVKEIAVPPSSQSGRVHVYALQASPVTRIAVSGPKQLLRGRTLHLRVRLDAGKANPRQRLLRVEALDPKGRPASHYQSFLTLNRGIGEAAVPFALNDAPGKWTLRVTDVASGVAGEMKTTLR